MERLLTLWIQDLELKNNPCATAHIKIKAKSLFDSIKEKNIFDPKFCYVGRQQVQMMKLQKSTQLSCRNSLNLKNTVNNKFLIHITKKHNTQSAYQYFWYAEPALYSIIGSAQSHYLQFCSRMKQIISIPYRMKIPNCSQIHLLNLKLHFCPACPTWIFR